MAKYLPVVVLLALFAPTWVLPASYLSNSGTVEGAVTDQLGLAIAQVEVRLVERARRFSRMVRTNDIGYFRFERVEPGTYDISASAPGFTEQVLTGLEVDLNRIRRADFQLSVAGTSNQVEVAALRVAVDSTVLGISRLMEEQEIQSLPLNGRDYVQLSTLQAGVLVARAQSRDFNNGFGLPLSIAGSRPVQNSFSLDGIEVSDHSGATPGGVNGMSLGTDAIQEVSILSSVFGAHEGSAAGGLVQAVTRSGASRFHGSAYFYHRNDNLDARNFFDPGEPPEFRRHQFGLSFGGPILSERLFFFSNQEWLRQVRGNTQVDTTLSRSAREGMLQDGQVEVDPLIARLIDFYPQPNGQVLGDSGLFVFSNDLDSAELFSTQRIDFQPGEADQLMFRYTVNGARREDETTFALGTRKNSSRHQSLAVGETHFFSPSFLLATRVGFSRSRTINNLSAARLPGLDNPELAFLPGSSTIGLVTVPGLSQFPGGTGALDADKAAFNSFQLYQDYSWQKQAHSFSFGIALVRKHLNLDSQNRQSGEFRFGGIGDFLVNRPNRFSAQLPGSDTVRGFRQTMFAWYLHDTWRLSRRVNLDFGLRHELTFVPTEVNGKLANLRELTSSEMTVGQALYSNPSLAFVTPRLGLAWDFSGSGRSVLRVGYGLFADAVGMHYLLLTGVRNPPFFARGSVRNLQPGSFPGGGYEALANNGSPELRVERIPHDLKQPYLQHWNVTLEQALSREATVRLSYVGSHGLHLTSIVEDANLAQPVILSDGRRYFPADAAKVNPAFGAIRNREFQGHSFYHSFQGSLRWVSTRTVAFSTAYTFSRSIDDSSTTFAQTEAVNAIGIPVNGDSRFNRGLSNHHQKHRWTSSLIWRLPSPAGGKSKLILGEWSLSFIGVVTSGLPFGPTLAYDAARTQTSRPDRLGGQRPDAALGYMGDVITGNPEAWFDSAAFARPSDGFLGNVGRNVLIGPGYSNVDLSLAKRWPMGILGEDAFLDLRVEAFNLLNHANFDLPAPERLEVFTRTGGPEDVGRITSAAAGREIQLGMKLVF